MSENNVVDTQSSHSSLNSSWIITPIKNESLKSPKKMSCKKVLNFCGEPKLSEESQSTHLSIGITETQNNVVLHSPSLPVESSIIG